MSRSRYAIYFAPPPESRLWALGSKWLGRDAATDEAILQPEVGGISSNRLRQITDTARRYGFHATLKPPFHLAGGTTPGDLEETVEKHAMSLKPFTIRLTLSVLDDFLVLTTPMPNNNLKELANSCVASFDRFRAPASEDELKRRRAATLTGRQQANLERWGYPYVFEDFRFHMTLSSRLPEHERSIVSDHLRATIGPIENEEIAVDALAIFRQPTADASFVMTRRIPLGASGHSVRSAKAS